MEMIMDKLLLSPHEAAVVLGVGRSHVYDLMRSHRVSSVKTGRSRRIPAEALRAHVATSGKGQREVRPAFGIAPRSR
jgi:excisionase family DNA binding protein